jgi:hypothetical protein
MKCIQNFALLLGNLSGDLLAIRKIMSLIFSTSVNSPSTEYRLFSSALLINLISFILKIKARNAMNRYPLRLLSVLRFAGISSTISPQN